MTVSQTTTIARDVRLDLGETDLVGDVDYSIEGSLILTTASGARQILAERHFANDPEATLADEGHVQVEAFGRHQKLADALVGAGLCEEVSTRTAGMWSATVHTLRVIKGAA